MKSCFISLLCSFNFTFLLEVKHNAMVKPKSTIEMARLKWFFYTNWWWRNIEMYFTRYLMAAAFLKNQEFKSRCINGAWIFWEHKQNTRRKFGVIWADWSITIPSSRNVLNWFCVLPYSLYQKPTSAKI